MSHVDTIEESRRQHNGAVQIAKHLRLVEDDHEELHEANTLIPYCLIALFFFIRVGNVVRVIRMLKVASQFVLGTLGGGLT
jgi:hypothetical protein